jgi:D-beta-D-heptose 7-phosphate kinase/D-beta-D-heptose 1-phosphate adenosyltransferase
MRIMMLLKRRGILPATLLPEPDWITPHKVRIVAHQHQLLRLDTEDLKSISPHTSQALARSFARWVPKLQALIISDYRKGTVTPELNNQFKTLARERRLPIFVDPKPEYPEVCRHATVVTPNLHVAERMAGFAMRENRQIEKGRRNLLTLLEFSNLLITRVAEGMTLFEAGGGVYVIPGIPRPVYDVTGAGDTVLAVLALATRGRAATRSGRTVQNCRGGVVLKLGTAEISAQELLDAITGNFRNRSS